MYYFFKLIKFILNLKPYFRRLLLILLDIIIIFLSVYLFAFFKVGHIFNNEIISLLKILPIFYSVSIPFYIVTGQYKPLSRYVGSPALYELTIRNAFLLVIIFIFSSNLPFRIDHFDFIFLWIYITGFTCLVRLIIRDFINAYSEKKENATRIAIYGAGSAGAQLAISLKIEKKYKIICFFDDNKNLQTRTLNGLRIYNPKLLPSLKHKIDQVLLAIPSISQTRRLEIISFLEANSIKTYTIPSFIELKIHNQDIKAIRPLSTKDLLGRETVEPNKEILGRSVKNKIICVTGAGGSIGSELCKQIIFLQPKEIILIDNSEPNLYKTNQELQQLKIKNVKIFPILCCATNEQILNEIFSKHKINSIFHAAAYKHVPLVEDNPIAGLKNNIFSTIQICKMAFKFNTERIILISSDKAVRPCNVMGASKRLSELIFQSYANDVKNNNQKNTLFSMVRFGNVLDSSGSVVPLFRKQIENGGPLTLTDTKITRFFMTIKEASQLVIQAGELAKGGDVFLLDMGESVKIIELARKMIKLSGKNVKNDTGNKDDIEIKITGLRPGEKLFEELLIDAKSQKTEHPKIFKANEDFINSETLNPKLDSLINQIINNDKEGALNTLQIIVQEWERKI